MPVSLPPLFLFPPKHLAAHDRIWIISDVETYKSAYKPQSVLQTMFRVGAFDLNADRFRVVTFGNDIAYSLIKAGIELPPWKAPQPVSATIVRASHGNLPQGRFPTSATLEPLDPALVALGPRARKLFAGEVYPNVEQGAWDALRARAERENRIEAAALAQPDWFAAGELAKITGDTQSLVSATLVRLVRDGRIVPNGGKKRGAKYHVASPALIVRADRTG